MTDHRDELRRLAKETFGWPHLYDEQLDAMDHVVAGHDVLVVLPTGAGKSAIYQVPALVLDGPAVVVSPLIALQNDQIESIADSGAPRAVALNSAQRAEEYRDAWDAVREGRAGYVFLSPEQLAKDDVVTTLAECGVGLFVVDEAHCVSAWGHDFRPHYLRLGHVLDRLGRPVTVALTATAAPPVRRDIAERLGLREHREVMASFDRPNLHLSVSRFTADEGKRAAVVELVREKKGAGLVYTASRKDTEWYAGELTEAGVRAAAYHAGMKAADRERVHQEFLDGAVDVVVATSAFGMGIDKPDVRFVVHASIPDSLDTYYQQIGRAGRDDEPAEIVLCYRHEDLNLQRFLTASQVPEDTIGALVRALAEHDTEHEGPLSRADLEARVDAAPARRARAVNLLEEVGAVIPTGSGDLVAAPGLTVRNAVERAVAAEEARQRLVESRVEMMRDYAETTGCRRQRLLGYFGQELLDPCGSCDTCEAGTARRRDSDGEFPVDTLVEHAEWGQGTVMSAEEDRITVLFDEVGYKSLSLPVVREQRLLDRRPAG